MRKCPNYVNIATEHEQEMDGKNEYIDKSGVYKTATQQMSAVSAALNRMQFDACCAAEDVDVWMQLPTNGDHFTAMARTERTATTTAAAATAASPAPGGAASATVPAAAGEQRGENWTTAAAEWLVCNAGAAIRGERRFNYDLLMAAPGAYRQIRRFSSKKVYDKVKYMRKMFENEKLPM